MIEKFNNERLSLARLQKSDVVDMYHALKNSIPEISPWLSWLTPQYDLNSADGFVKLQINNWHKDIEYTFAIRDTQGEYIGNISLHMFDSVNDVASIGYWVDTQKAGNGYCTQALKLLVANTLTQLNLIRIEVIVAVENIASQKVALNAGSTFEAILKNRIRLHNKAVDAKVYAFFNP
ncbi:MAG: GNAT family N-acetyltransferase [Proteobacteria bacterium]|nr:GNAT family N-acetyltransferase [Pseudomonadota bacterium]